MINDAISFAGIFLMVFLTGACSEGNTSTAQSTDETSGQFDADDNNDGHDKEDDGDDDGAISESENGSEPLNGNDTALGTTDSDLTNDDTAADTEESSDSFNDEIENNEADDADTDEKETGIAAFPDSDQDSDGFTPAEGDCNDAEALINPFAKEVVDPETAVDNDCDGTIDEVENCDLVVDGNSAVSLAAAMGLCDDRFLLKAERVFTAQAGDVAYDTLTRAGDNDCLTPREGLSMAVLGTGPLDSSNPNANRAIDNDWFIEQMLMGNNPTMNYPDPQPEFQAYEPSFQETQDVCDVSQLKLQLRAPANASGFSFDFVFASSEYNEFINAGFNDTFYAILEYKNVNNGATTNISFDSNLNEIEVDNNYFENEDYACDESGSGWEPDVADVSGSTGWLRTTWRLGAPLDTFTITFSIHDEGDCVFDSAVFLDNFQWITEEVEIVEETKPVVLE